MDFDKEIEKIEKQLKSIESAYIRCLGVLDYLKAQKKEVEEGKKEKDKK